MKNNRGHIRKEVLENFLGHTQYRLIDLPIDCSFRTYHRVCDIDKKILLMDSPPDKEDINPFIKVSKLLKEFQLPVPEIYHVDLENGIALIEDFGDDLMKKIIGENSGKRIQLYKLAIDLLIKFQQRNHKVSVLEEYDEHKLMRESLLFSEWYYPKIFNKEISEELLKEFKNILSNLFNKINYKTSVIVLRDYHAENIMIIRDKHSSEESLGIIDYQDAVIGSYAYDLVSLLEDARTEVDKSFREKMLGYYLNNASFVAKEKFLQDYIILGIQRNLKIIGIFARKAIRDNNSNYLKYIPRMWRYITDNINHPLLGDLKNWFAKIDLNYKELSNED